MIDILRIMYIALIISFIYYMSIIHEDYKYLISIDAKKNKIKKKVTFDETKNKTRYVSRYI
jgi:hypothetical protein